MTASKDAHKALYRMTIRMKIYVVKSNVQGKETEIGYALTYNRAEKIALTAHVDDWKIEKWPVGYRLTKNPAAERRALVCKRHGVRPDESLEQSTVILSFAEPKRLLNLIP